MRDSVLEEERFQKRLAKLRSMNPRQKANARRRIDERETNFAERHRQVSHDILDRRTAERELFKEEEE